MTPVSADVQSVFRMTAENHARVHIAPGVRRVALDELKLGHVDVVTGQFDLLARRFGGGHLHGWNLRVLATIRGQHIFHMRARLTITGP